MRGQLKAVCSSFEGCKVHITQPIVGAGPGLRMVHTSIVRGPVLGPFGRIRDRVFLTHPERWEEVWIVRNGPVRS